MTTSAPKSFDFAAAFTSIDTQEAGAEFELMPDAPYLDADGRVVLNEKGRPKGTGFFITLAGPDSEKRRKLAAKTNRIVLRAVDQSGKVKDEDIDPVNAEYEAAQMDEMVAGTLAWRFPAGFEGPECNPKEVRALYTKHPSIYRQVLARSGDLSRFIKR